MALRLDEGIEEQADGVKDLTLVDHAGEGRDAGSGATECEACGDDFDAGKLYHRRARGMNICIQCALHMAEQLEPEDLNDLSEHYWSGREQD